MAISLFPLLAIERRKPGHLVSSLVAGMLQPNKAKGVFQMKHMIFAWVFVLGAAGVAHANCGPSPTNCGMPGGAVCEAQWNAWNSCMQAAREAQQDRYRQQYEQTGTYGRSNDPYGGQSSNSNSWVNDQNRSSDYNGSSSRDRIDTIQ